MFKSVFIKYLAVFALIIFISFSLLSVIVGSMVNTYAVDSKAHDVAWVLDIAKTAFDSMYQDSSSTNFETTAASPSFQAILSAFTENHTELLTFAVSVHGKIVAADDRLSALGILGKTLETSTIERALGNNSFDKMISLPIGDQRLYYVSGVPIENNSAEVVGLVFVCSSTAGEQALVSLTTKTIIMASLWIMLAALIAVYFVSDRMVSPLRSMIDASKQFAKGNFNERIAITSHDEIGELADAFNQMADSLSHLEKMRSSFLANVSHDLRTPMTTIAGFIDGINSGAIPPEQQSHYLNIVSSEVHRLSRLVGQLLNLSRMESGERKFTSEQFDICEVARLILISFEQKIDAKRLNVDFDTDKDSMIAFSDKDAIYQVLYNLIENAIKFSAEDGVLRIQIRDGKDGKFRIQVYNEGKGIKKEDLPFIFDRFYKSDKSRGLDKTGVGLGLFIVKTIIDANGESIIAESEENNYCLFEFTLKQMTVEASKK